MTTEADGIVRRESSFTWLFPKFRDEPKTGIPQYSSFGISVA
jgi:hypothetical protein